MTLPLSSTPPNAAPPWQAVHTSNGAWTIRTMNGDPIAEMWIIPSGAAPANAAFIVRACNAHDDLLGKAKAMLVAVDSHFPNEPFLRAEADALAEAIAKVEE